MIEQPDVVQAGIGAGTLLGVLAALNAAGTLCLVRCRNALLGVFIDSDQDDDSGIAGAALLGAFLVRRAAEEREKKSLVPCPECGIPNLPVALQCSRCGEPSPAPKKLSPIGMATSSDPVTSRAEHRQHLLQWKRCPACGTSLKKKGFTQECPQCSRSVFLNEREARDYLAKVEAKMPRVALVSGAIGFVPILRLIAGVLYYRWSLIPGLRRYLTRTETFAGRWTIRGINFTILWFQPVPLLGALTLPAMCLTNFTYYRRLFLRHLATLERTERGPAKAPALPRQDFEMTENAGET